MTDPMNMGSHLKIMVSIISHGNQKEIMDSGLIEALGNLPIVVRENMSECGSKVYEDLRKQFVQDRIDDKEHPGHSKYIHRSQTWNGVSPGMWESDDWVDYLRKNGFDAEADELRPTVNTIDSLFA